MSHIVKALSGTGGVPLEEKQRVMVPFAPYFTLVHMGKVRGGGNSFMVPKASCDLQPLGLSLVQ